MKHNLLFFAIFIMMAVSANLSAENITVDGIKYSTSGTTATVTGCTIDGDINIPESVIYNEETYNVISIGVRTFQNCSNLTSITIPQSITSIGSDAFRGCTGKLIVNCNIGDAEYPTDGWFFRSDFSSVEIGKDVTSIGKYAFYGCSSLSEITIPQSITSIGQFAFYGCTGKLIVNCNIGDAEYSSDGWFYSSDFSSVEIGKDVTSIGKYAFENCSNLSSILVAKENLIYDSRDECNAIIESATNKLIQGCSTSVIPNSVTSIGDYAFMGCSFESISIPNSVTGIGSWAFYDCTGKLIVNCNIGDAEDPTDGWFFSSDFSSVEIGKDVTSIGIFAFYFCNKLTSILVAKENLIYDSRDECNAIIESATNKLIQGCSTSVIPNSVTSIGNYAFYGCSSLSEITIPQSITSIGQFAFYGCTGKLIVNCNIGDAEYSSDGWFYRSHFSSVEIGKDVTSIGKYAFPFCTKLKSILVAKENLIYDSRDECNAIIESATNKLIKGCSKTVIPNSVASIGDAAFMSCSFESITIPQNIISIGHWAFDGCTGKLIVNCNINNDAFKYSKFSSVEIGEGVTTIGDDAFYSCSNLSEITIPSSLTSIGNSAFIGCRGLVSLTCLADTPPTVGASCFYDVDKSLCTLYVKKNTTSLYASADGWSDFFNIVEIEDQYTGLDQIQADLETETVYDLSGNRVLQKHKGRTYIRNGKKILVK